MKKAILDVVRGLAIYWHSSYLSAKEMELNYKALYENAEATNNKLKLFWVTVGREDFLCNSTVEFMDFLKSKGVNFKGLVTTRGHTWLNTKKYLAKTVQSLFQ